MNKFISPSIVGLNQKHRTPYGLRSPQDCKMEMLFTARHKNINNTAVPQHRKYPCSPQIIRKIIRTKKKEERNELTCITGGDF